MTQTNMPVLCDCSGYPHTIECALMKAREAGAYKEPSATSAPPPGQHVVPPRIWINGEDGFRHGAWSTIPTSKDDIEYLAAAPIQAALSECEHGKVAATPQITDPKLRANSFKAFLAEQMKDQEFAEAYEQISAKENELLGQIFAAEREAAETDWQPIETAPKMKTVILWADTSTADLPNWRMGTGFFHDDMKVWVWEGEQVRDWAFPPTHWMPLPPAPESRHVYGRIRRYRWT